MQDCIVLKNGKRLYANKAILGIGPDLAITEGYDGHITHMPDEEDEGYDKDCIFSEGLSKNEIVEIADIAIERWQRLKQILTNIKLLP